MTVLFTAWGYDVTVLEFASVILAFVAVGLGIRGTRWAWPFYFLSGLLYGWLFVEFDLFASAALQVVFMIAAIWGWFTWGREGVRVPGQLTNKQRLISTAGVLVLWVLLAPLLQSIGGAATWADAFIFVGSLGAQLLMIFEKVEAWPAWILVNIVGTVLYATQGLYFTSLFYAALILMAITGWRAWSQRATNAAPAESARMAQSV